MESVGPGEDVAWPMARPIIQATTYANPEKAIHRPPFIVIPPPKSVGTLLFLTVIVRTPFQDGLESSYPPGLLSPYAHQHGIDHDNYPECYRQGWESSPC